jgi:quercetin dioxygenase-like cupin family protein
MPDLRPTAFVIAPGAVVPIRGPVGGPTTILARAETTGGAFTMLENVIPPLQGPPLHVHRREDEMWFVLEGHFRFRADDPLLEAPAGSFVYVPRGTRHAFQNIGDGPARILVMFSPAGMERFFEDIAALPDGPIDPATYRTIAHDLAMEVAGPPLADSDPI